MSNIYLVIILALFVAAIAVLFIRSRPLKLARFVLIGLLIASGSAVVFSTESYKGWPSEEKIDHGLVKGVEIVYPDTNSIGGIFIWVYPDQATRASYSQFLYKYPEIAPRNYVLPYSKQGAKKWLGAKKALENGDNVEVQGGSGSGERRGKGSMDGGPDGGKGLNGGKEAKGNQTGPDAGDGAPGDKANDGDDYTLKVTPLESLPAKPNL